MILDEFFDQYIVERTETKYSNIIENTELSQIQDKEDILDDEMKEKILKRWRVPSFLSMLKI